MRNKSFQSLMAATSAVVFFLTSLIPTSPVILAAEGMSASEIYEADIDEEVQLEEPDQTPEAPEEIELEVEEKKDTEQNQTKVKTEKEGKKEKVIEPIKEKKEELSEDEKAYDPAPFKIKHQAITQISLKKDLTVKANVPQAQEVTLTYQTAKNMTKETVKLERQGETDDFSLTLDKDLLKDTFWSPTFYYTIQAMNDQKETIKTDTYEVSVEQNTQINTQDMPHLLITELVPDTRNVNKKDAYEFIEIYNNSNQAIKMSDYNIIYRYPDGKSDLIWEITDDKYIQPQDAFIVWIHNDGNKHLTLDDFNQQFGLSLTEDKVAIIESVGMANTAERTIVLADQNLKEITSASYQKDQVKADQGIIYQYPLSGNAMKMVGLSETITPTQLIAGQVPEHPVDMQEQETETLKITHKPIEKIDNKTNVTINATIPQAKEAFITYQTNKGMPTEKIALKNDGESDDFYLTLTKDSLAEILWAPTFYYSIEARDANNQVTQTDKYQVEVELNESFDSQSLPSLLITELMPDTVNVNGSDAYEFIEIYNNTNQAINLSDYQLIYRYPDGKPDQLWPFQENKIIPAQSSFVVWIHNSGNKHLNLDDFNTYYNQTLKESELTIIESDGLANGAERTLIIADSYKNEISSATYNENGKEVVADQGILYRYPLLTSEMTKVGLGLNGTPGKLLSGQVPDTPVKIKIKGEAPRIKHEKPILDSETDIGSDIELKVKVSSEETLLGVNIHLSQSKNLAKEIKALKETNEPGVYTLKIPHESIWSDRLYYEFSAANESGETRTETFELDLPQVEIDYQKLPELLITELVPDSSNVNSLDAYEFIEVYNNTNKPIDFNDYVIRYRYPNVGKPGDLIWEAETQDKMMINSKEAIVLWIINSGNEHLSDKDFNRNYQTHLVEGENLFRLHSNGMANGTERTLVIASKTGHEVSRASYNTDVNIKDVAADKGILYRYPLDGTTELSKISAGELSATPGQVLAEQVPKESVIKATDKQAPKIEDLTKQNEIKAEETLDLEAKITDDQQVKAVSVFYRTDPDQVFTEVNLEEKTPHHFTLTVSEAEFIGRDSLDYYFVASDGTHTSKTEVNTLKIKQKSKEKGLRLNIDENELVSQETLIKATPAENTETSVFINDKELKNAEKALESDAFFAFEVRKTDLYFKNGVTMNDEILHIFDDTTNEYTTLLVKIEPERLRPGNNTISVRAGTKVSPFDLESNENRDDFYMKNIRLILADGTLIRDAKFSNPITEYAIGDSAGMDAVYDFSFDIDNKHFNSHAFIWDTRNVDDGKHQVSATDGKERIKRNVIVDNTAPEIHPTINDGQTYKGKFTIDAEFIDQVSEVTEVRAVLNDNHISLPYETSSALLEAGTHQVTFTALDAAGNHAEKQVTFKVDGEKPNTPNEVQSEAQATEANLAVKVTDPTKDDLTVSFYKAQKYLASDSEMTISTHASETEPPTEFRPQGEKEIEKKQYQDLIKANNKTITTEATDAFPYHRFDVTVDETVDADDQIEVLWQGESLAGRKVTMYAWNYKTEKWEALVSHIAGEDAFQLIGEVKAEDYLKDQQVSVIVQDEIAKTETKTETDQQKKSKDDFTVDDGEFSFVWFTDTQYYSESYPHIYESQVKWMVEQEKNLNLKYVFHTGDLVDKHQDMKQWEVADRNMKILDDANIPYGVLAGNHDVGHKEIDYTNYYSYFGDHRFEDKPYFGGSYLNNRGHYDLISAEGNDFIMIYAGWGMGEDEINWMNQVLEHYPNRKAILNFHEYLLASGSRSPIADRIYEEVVVPNKNVYAVLSGHYHNAQTLIDEIDDNGDGETDRLVYQMLADYQAGPEGGQGFLRILTFNPEKNTMDVKTYSPYLNKFNFFEPEEFPNKDEFNLDFDLTAQLKKVETDFIKVNVYTNDLIDQVENIPSGETAAVVWSDLSPNETYHWYVLAEDAYDGKMRSQIWSFMTKDGEIVDVPDPDEDEDIESIEPDKPGSNSDKPSQPTQPELPNHLDGNETIKDSDPIIPNETTHNQSLEQKADTNIQTLENKPSLVKDQAKTGTKLPGTTSHLYNYLFIGSLLLIGGIIAFVRLRARKKELF